MIEAMVYETLTKKHYNREDPCLKTQLKERISRSMAKKEPIKLIGFWGVGPKSRANWADLASCKFLAKLNEEVNELYPPGIELTFIFATIHGIHNGIDKKTIESYTRDIERIFKKFKFRYIYLERLWEKYGINFDKIDGIFEKKPKGWWGKIKNAKFIEKNAKNRNKRLPPLIAAQKYYIMRNLEKSMLEKEFPDSIFYAFADSRLRNVLPNMPTLYLYSRKGWSDSPWFITERN